MIYIDLMALAFVGFAIGIYLWIHSFFKGKKGGVPFSALLFFSSSQQDFWTRFSKAPSFFWNFGIAFLILSFLDPHRFVANLENQRPQEGIALYLVLDRSGSMGKVVDQNYTNGKWTPVTRWDQLQKTTQAFIKNSSQVLIGLVAFARSAQIISPLTSDLSALEKKIDALTVIKDPVQDGTAIGYAIYKTAHLIGALKEAEPTFDIKKTAMIVITDGFQDPSYLDRGQPLRTIEMKQAAEFAKEKGIALYIINIDEEINKKQFAPNKKELESTAIAGGGEWILATDLPHLNAILSEIEHMEKSRAGIQPLPPQIKKIVYYQPFLLFGLFCVMFSFVLSKTVWSQLG